MVRKKRRAAAKNADPHPLAHHGMWPYAQQFLAWSAAMGYSEGTIETRQQMLRYFMAWCDDRGLDKPQDSLPGSSPETPLYLAPGQIDWDALPENLAEEFLEWNAKVLALQPASGGLIVEGGQ